MSKVEERSGIVNEMLKEAQPIVDLAKGGENMRQRGTTYLPQFPQETEGDYKARKNSTWLFDGVGKAIEDMTGKIFEKPVHLAEQDGELYEYAQNIDMEGRDLSNFARDVFEDAVKMGVSFILADAPPRPGPLTVGQARAMNLRPYLVHVPLDQVLGWKWESINNTPTLTQFRMMETIPAPDRGRFSSETVEQIRVLEIVEGGRVLVELYRQNEEKKWMLAEEYLTEQTQIMVAPVYTGRTGFMTAKPPLARLAELNLAHWRSQSDQANIMHHARAPMKYFHGYSQEDLQSFAEGPGYAFFTSNESASVGVIEHSGSAIEAGRVELKDLEQQMQWVGLQLMMSRTGTSTATGDAIDERKGNSRLAMWADNLKDAMEIALDWMTQLGGFEDDTTVNVNKDFSTLAHMTMADVRDMFVQRAITGQTYIREAQRRGVLSEDIEPTEEYEKALMGETSDPTAQP